MNATNGANGGGNGQGDGSGRKRRNRKRRNRSTTKQVAEFWGDADALPEPRDEIRITPDPAAVVRSLGRLPLPGQEQAAEAYLEAVYGRAVGLAGALAAAGELIEPQELLDEL